MAEIRLRVAFGLCERSQIFGETPSMPYTARRTLAGFEDPALLRRALDATLTDAVRVQDVARVCSSRPRPIRRVEGWRMSVATAVRRIEAGTEHYYTSVGSKRADVQAVKVVPKHIRTVADNAWLDNLLSLPAVPQHFKLYT